MSDVGEQCSVGTKTGGAASAASTDRQALVPPTKIVCVSGAASSSMETAIGGSTAAVGGSAVNEEIEQLLQQQRDIRDQRKKVAIELKNAQRRRRRLKHRARLLSSIDLLTVLGLRSEETNANKQKSADKDRDGGTSDGGHEAAQSLA